MAAAAVIIASCALLGSLTVLIWAGVFYHRALKERAAADERTAEHDELLFQRLADELRELVYPAEWDNSGRHAAPAPALELVDTAELDDLAGIRPLVGPDGVTQEGEWP